jgi:hypothetical protein
MADRYAVTGEQLVVEVSPGETILNLFNSPAAPVTRGEVFYFSASAGGTMADQVQRVQLQRTTAVGTEGAGVTPAAFNDVTLAGSFDAGEDHSVEPTFGAATELWEEDVHVRALAQIQLQPDGHFLMPATQFGGLGMRSFSATYGGSAHGTIHYME